MSIPSQNLLDFPLKYSMPKSKPGSKDFRFFKSGINFFMVSPINMDTGYRLDFQQIAFYQAQHHALDQWLLAFFYPAALALLYCVS